MSLLRIRTWGDPVLKTRAQKIENITDEIRTLAANMMETMQAESGVGLAANQVGVAQRLFVAEITSKTGPSKRYMLINPEITATGAEVETVEEGCLSFPGIYGPVERKKEVELRGTDLSGKIVTLSASGLLARAFQHELDHLDGVVFIERMKMVHRVLLSRSLRELSKHTLSTLAGRGTPKI